MNGAPKTPEAAAAAAAYEAMCQELLDDYVQNPMRWISVGGDRRMRRRDGVVIDLAARAADFAQRKADFAQREAAARAALVAKVRSAVERAVTDDVDLAYADGHLGDSGYQAMAEAAVDVFVDLLRNPPVREHHPDGTEVVRWPGDEVMKLQLRRRW